jgi:dethiobiotin synthetase
LSKNIFITGTGTGVGKTLVAAIVAEAIGAGYWKPVQAGYENGTDSLWIRSMVSNPAIIVHPELHILQMRVAAYSCKGGR